MNNNNLIESAIADTFQKAVDYLKSHGWFPYFLLCFWSVVFVIAAIGDYGLSYDFFYNLAKNEFGIVPEELLHMVQLKAFLGTSIVLILECCFYYLSRAVQRLTFWCLLILILFALCNIGGAQIYPLLDNHIQSEYPEESSNNAFDELFGVGTEDPVKTEQEPVIEDGNSSIEESVGKHAFIKSAKWYRFAFLLFSFLGVVAIINMKKIVKVIGNLARAKQVVDRYRLLERCNQHLQGHDNDLQCLRDNKNILYRAAQEEVLAAFTCGLRYLKTQLHNLIIYGEKNDDFSVYSFWQVIKWKWLYAMNIDATKDIIQKAEESLHNIRLVNPEEHGDENSLGEAIDKIDPGGFNDGDNAATIESVFEEE
mgnify:CR=1 FL=1